MDGDWRYDSRRSCLLWTIDLIDDTNRSGSLEFVVPAAEAESFFPVEVSFSANRTLCDIEIDSVVNAATGAPVKYGYKRALTTANYVVA